MIPLSRPFASGLKIRSIEFFSGDRAFCRFRYSFSAGFENLHFRGRLENVNIIHYNILYNVTLEA